MGAQIVCNLKAEMCERATVLKLGIFSFIFLSLLCSFSKVQVFFRASKSCNCVGASKYCTVLKLLLLCSV